MTSSIQATKTLEDGSSLEVLVQEYADRILVLITQLGKVGNLIQAIIPETSPLPSTPDDQDLIPEPPTSIQLTQLFGSAPSERLHTLHSIYTTHAATIVWVSEAKSIVPTPRRPVVVGIALKSIKSVLSSDDSYSKDKELFDIAMTMLKELLRNR